jgi:hypothetical protein
VVEEVREEGREGGLLGDPLTPAREWCPWREGPEDGVGVFGRRGGAVAGGGEERAGAGDTENRPRVGDSESGGAGDGGWSERWGEARQRGKVAVGARGVCRGVFRGRARRGARTAAVVQSEALDVVFGEPPPPELAGAGSGRRGQRARAAAAAPPEPPPGTKKKAQRPAAFACCSQPVFFPLLLPQPQLLQRLLPVEERAVPHLVHVVPPVERQPVALVVLAGERVLLQVDPVGGGLDQGSAQ